MADKPRSWIGFFLDRPIGVFTALITLFVLGTLAYNRLPLQFLPSGWGNQWISVWVQAPDSNPYETMERITRHVEEEVATISGVTSTRSNSSSNSAWVRIAFTGTMDMDLAYAEVRDRMERVRPLLPNGSDRYFIWRNNIDESFPIMFGALLFDLDSSEDRVNYLAEEIIQKKIESIDGVSRMQVFGTLSKSLRILLDEDRCRAARINLYDVINRLSQDNFATPAGFVEDAGKRYLLRVNSRFENIEEIENWPVNERLLLKDIAKVKYVQSVREWYTRFNGKFSLFCGISKESGANTVKICDKVLATFKDIEKQGNLAGFRFYPVHNEGKWIESAMGTLGSSGLWGGLLALGVLFIFLHRVRLTLFIILTIPLSFLIAMIVQYFTGGSLNICSLMGLTIGIGMVIDNAIVVVENTTRLKNEGVPFREAVIRGGKEVGLAITMATLTSIIVFVPFIFIYDDKSFRLAFTAIGISLSVSLLASLLVAMVFIPSAIYHLHGRNLEGKNRWAQKLPTLIPFLTRKTQSLVGWSLKHRLATSFILFFILASTVIPMEFIGKTLEESGGDHYHVQVELPRNFNVYDAKDELQYYEDFLLKQKQAFLSQNIEMNFRVNFHRKNARFLVLFNPPFPLEEFRELIKKTREKFPKRPGTNVRFRAHLSGEGEEEDSGFHLALTGKDPELLAEIGKEVQRRVEKIPDVYSVTTSLERGNEEVRIKLDREKTSALSLSPQAITEIIEWGLRGRYLPRYRDENREIPFIIQFEQGADESLNKLRDLTIFTPAQTEVPLEAIANFEVGRGYGNIQRKDRKTSLWVNIESDEKDHTILGSKVQKSLAGLVLPQGYEINPGEEFRQWEQNAGDMFQVLLLAMVLVFLLMGILFESSLLPVSVLSTILFAICGGFWFLYLTGTSLDVIGMIGFVILGGIVVNNGVLLVDHINRLRKKEGMERKAAILKGCADRLRPILMTALTTIVGLLPMTLIHVNPREGISYHVLSATVIGGLCVSTLFTLWVVPLLYTMIEDLRTNVAGAFSRAFRPFIKLSKEKPA